MMKSTLKKTWAKKCFWGMLTGFLILLVGIVWFCWPVEAQKTEKTTPIKVKIQEIGTMKGNSEQYYAGEIRSIYETELSFQTTGKILSRQVKVGDRVKRGDVIASLDTRDLEQHQRSSLASEANAQSQLKLAKKNMDRYQQLLAVGAISQSVYDSYEQQYESSQAAVMAGQADVSASSNQLGYGVLTADRDGIIMMLKAEQGQVVSAGEVVAAIADEDALQIVFSIPEQQMEKLTVGDIVSVTLTSTPMKTYQASVREISPVADNSTRTFLVKAKMLEIPKEMRLGMTAQVVLDSPKDASLQVPRSAICKTTEGMGVWTYQAGKAVFCPIVAGSVENDMVVVMDGLIAGSKVVVAGVQKLYEGAPLEVLHGSE